MPGDQVRHQVLLFTQSGVDLFITLSEGLVDSRSWLAHRPQSSLADVFGCHFQLSADMMAADFFEKVGFFVHQNGVKPDPGTDEDFFDTFE